MRHIITTISNDLGEPRWLLSFREEKMSGIEAFPRSLKYGLGISGLDIDEAASFEHSPEYTVDASKGVEIYTWKEAVAQEELAPYLLRLMQSKLYPISKTQGALRAAALFRSGIVIYAQPSMDESGVLREERAALTTTLKEGESASDVVIIIVKEGASLVVENIYEGKGGMLARTLVVLSESDARATIIERNNELHGGKLFLTNKALIARHSSVLWKEVFLGDASVQSHTNTVLAGEGARADTFQALIPEGHAVHDIFASVEHVASETNSVIRAAGIGLDNTKTVYRGLIDMKHGAESVAGAQEGKFVVLSPHSRVDAIPSLDIASNSVACTHKLSIDHVREGDIFYPKLRGFSDEESKRLFIEGSFAQVFAEEGNEGIMEDIRTTLSSRKI